MIRVVHPGSGSRIRNLIFTRPGSRNQKGTGSRIRNTAAICLVFRQNVYGFLDSEAESEDPGTFSYRDMEVRDNRQVDLQYILFLRGLGDRHSLLFRWAGSGSVAVCNRIHVYALDPVGSELVILNLIFMVFFIN